MNHSTELPASLNTVIFYKAPLPLLIGNLPFGDNFKDKRHEYEYLDYYIVAGNTIYWRPDGGSYEYANGILFYNKFYKNYTILLGKHSSWSCMFPGFNINGLSYSLNPFVNDINGSCVWMNESSDYNDKSLTNPSDYSSAIIYYNFSKNRYEFGLGEDVDSYNDTYFPLSQSNFSNGYSASQGMVKLGYYVASTYSELRNFDLSTPFTSRIAGYVKTFEPDPTTTPPFNFNNLTDPENLNVNLYCSVINQKAKDYNNGFNSTIKDVQLLKIPSESRDTNQFLFDRLDILRDLDHEDEPAKYEKMCGVYENNMANNLKSFILGSLVIGNEEHRNDIGWFIGINEIVSNYYLFSQYDEVNSDRYKIQTTNVIPISKYRENNPGVDYNIDNKNEMNLTNFNFIITLGYAWKADIKRYLVYYLTNDKEGLYRRFRIFLVDNDPALLYSQRKIWYADLPVTDESLSLENIGPFSPELFKHPFSFPNYTETSFTSLTFNYINLDDEDDVKAPITFSIIGTCRENAYNELLGTPISNLDKEYRFNNTYYKTNAFIGYWDAPIVNFEEEENNE